MRDALLVSRATCTNLLARFAPKTYLRITGQTGRGDGDQETAADIANYFEKCFEDYRQRLGVASGGMEGFLAGKTVVEYGPGDFPGVALLCVAHGAAKVYCVDRFAMVKVNEKNLAVTEQLRLGLSAAARNRLDRAFDKSRAPQVSFNRDAIDYRVTTHGFAALDGKADLVISRAVLEHVDDLDGTFRDMQATMKPGAQAVHQVDLKSHGLHRSNPLDFLEWSATTWSLMFSHKGVPNRWRIDRYRRIVAALGVEDVHFEVINRASAADVAAVQPKLAPIFRDVSADDLACLGFWLQFTKAHPQAVLQDALS